MKIFPTLYKLDVKGKIRQWHMETDGARFRTVAGIVDGKLVTSEWTTTEAKNVGRSNATTAEGQAEAEVLAKYTKQIDSGYFDSIDQVHTVKFVKPMLADKWENRKDKLVYPAYVQPKLDGIRCVATADGLYSRTGKEIIAAPHIAQQLESVFAQYPDLVLDGELYNHDLKQDFNKIVSLVRKTKPTDADIAESAGSIQYHIYDCILADNSEAPFLDRYSFLNTQLELSGALELVDTEHCFSEQEVDEAYGEYISQGYEGGIVRTNGQYENKRSKNLLKRKDFEDAEFEIIRIEEGQGNWSGYAKRVIFRNDNGAEVGAGLKGNQAFAKQVLAEADEYIGKQVTVQFFTRTPDGIPRFPIAKVLHKQSRW